ncbi:2-amino-4-hydroxy-6-hydroxymethyldihydropteridine diphosphokinase [Colwellia psychrerythraea]|uniref:2-amino-4-hydroxy-6-hydroxymethyldihydropteridine diphosphokinase n=1 Tax=Colwellia psychrerythraea TaxID=28229 RepID=A0A099KJZ9_COLPS|nr:2-amino-4-hydroxy-6-hydroxymethyldihydropteridine diphosphokinase [Colwellia psychrerythraea]KGJ90726.1 2-amino-4-hydroxy-6-hydroxymethyldihydropteridine pyrophosphokinase [Colwellia psychrerythraea]
MAQIYISLGSNVEREQNVKQGLISLAKAFDLSFEQLTLSSLFECEAIGFNGPDFYNMVIGIKCRHSVEQVATMLREIEFFHGRDHNAKKFSPRTLDLDLLLYDNLVIDQPAQLPRDEITKNAFVLWPLSQVAPKLAHPILNNCYEKLWQDYNKNTQQLSIVANCW